MSAERSLPDTSPPSTDVAWPKDVYTTMRGAYCRPCGRETLHHVGLRFRAPDKDGVKIMQCIACDLTEEVS